MPEISVQHRAAALDNLEPCESFGEPVGALPLQTAMGFYEGDSFKWLVFPCTW